MPFQGLQARLSRGGDFMGLPRQKLALARSMRLRRVQQKPTMPYYQIERPTRRVLHRNSREGTVMHRTLWRQYLALCAVLGLCLALAACGASAGASTDAAGGGEKEAAAPRRKRQRGAGRRTGKSGILAAQFAAGWPQAYHERRTRRGGFWILTRRWRPAWRRMRRAGISHLSGGRGGQRRTLCALNSASLWSSMIPFSRQRMPRAM